MFEFVTVDLKTYTDPMTGDQVQLRLIHRTDHGSPAYTVDVKQRDLDKLALDEMATYEEALKLAEANALQLSEHGFDLSKVGGKITVPSR